MQYLNDLYRARVEKAGLSYIDVWDGFVDDSGRFMPAGRLTSRARSAGCAPATACISPGPVRASSRIISSAKSDACLAPGSEPVALPSSEPQAPAIAGEPSGPAARPLAGPVVPLTASVTSAQELIGSRDTGDPSAPKSVTRVLVNGEAVLPPAGRSDDFTWPRRAIAPVGADPVVATTTEPIPVMKPAPQTTVAAPNAEVRPVAAANPAPRRTVTTSRSQQQPWQQPSRNQGFFSFFR